MSALRAGIATLLLCLAAAAWAHKPSDSYLGVTVDGHQVSGRWDIALRDLDFAIGLDADGDGNITWGELRSRHSDIAAYAAARLALQADGRACALQVGAQQVDEHTDGAYTVLPLRWDCAGGAAVPQTLELQYTLFADLDPQHRGLLNLTVQGATRTAVLGPQASRQRFDLQAEASGLATLQDYGREGVWHIWIGFDHILFLLSLLLPAVGVWTALPGQTRAPHAWLPVSRFRTASWDVLRIVTAFTVAHSITLSLAALNNLRPVFEARRWIVAFVFGLVHGFGFASVLADLGLPQGALALALLGFNLGVEVGQLAIVAAFLPLAYLLRRSAFYRKAVLQGGSVLIALLAAVWLAERAFELKLMPF